jgi:hypothetical protein
VSHSFQTVAITDVDEFDVGSVMDANASERSPFERIP